MATDSLSYDPATLLEMYDGMVATKLAARRPAPLPLICLTMR